MSGIVERSFYDEATDSLTVQTLYGPPLGVTLGNVDWVRDRRAGVLCERTV